MALPIDAALAPEGVRLWWEKIERDRETAARVRKIVKIMRSTGARNWPFVTLWYRTRLTANGLVTEIGNVREGLRI